MPQDLCADDNGGDCNNGDPRHDTSPNLRRHLLDANEPTKENRDKTCLLLSGSRAALVLNVI